MNKTPCCGQILFRLHSTSQMSQAKRQQSCCDSWKEFALKYQLCACHLWISREKGMETLVGEFSSPRPISQGRVPHWCGSWVLKDKWVFSRQRGGNTTGKGNRAYKRGSTVLVRNWKKALVYLFFLHDLIDMLIFKFVSLALTLPRSSRRVIQPRISWSSWIPNNHV